MSKRLGLPAQMGIGMVLGIVVGAMAPSLNLEASWFKPLGDLFITLVRMVVVPLVFTTLVAGAASVCDVKELGRVASKRLFIICSRRPWPLSSVLFSPTCSVPVSV